MLLEIKNLPESSRLPIHFLNAVFKGGRITNSYKFYWFLSLIQIVEKEQTHLIHINQIATRMIANVWYPIHYFYLSFGKQDKLADVVKQIKLKICRTNG